MGKHEEKIISSWKDNVKEDDVVLVLEILHGELI